MRLLSRSAPSSNRVGPSFDGGSEGEPGERQKQFGRLADKVNQLLSEDKKLFVIIELDAPSTFDNVQRELYLLELHLIEELIRCHKLDRFVSISLNRVGSDDFMELSRDRQRAYMKGLQEIIDEYLASGKKAVEALENYIRVRKCRLL